MAKARSKALATWDEQLAKYAGQAAETERHQVGGTWFSLRGGQLSFNGQPIKGNKMDVVVVGSTIEYAYYGGKDFDPNDPQPPICYAFGDEEDDLAPHAEAFAKQHATCKGCPQNEFGSAEKGRGKACKNTRRLAMIPVTALDNDLKKAEIGFMKLPVMSVKGWAAYVKENKELRNRPPFGVITNFELVPDTRSQFKGLFNFGANAPDRVIGGLIEMYEKVKAEIGFPYQPPTETAKPAGKGAKKKAARKY